MRLLSELWYGNIDPQDRTIPRNSEYKKLLNTICEYGDKFRGIVPPEQQKDFEDYENATISVTAISEEAAFVYGFRLGAKTMLLVSVNYGMESGSSKVQSNKQLTTLLGGI